jgi:hypothetical protein
MNPLSSFVLLSTTVIALAAPLVAHSSSTGRVEMHTWRRTATEIVWRGRYSNCDYGYFIDLPEGAAAHSPKPPQPNHGAIVDLARPSSDEELSSHLRRYLSFDSRYNGTDSSSLTSVVDGELNVMGQDKKDFRVIAESPARMAGLPATLVKMSYADQEGAVIAVGIIAYRPPGARGLGNIIYKIMLTSTWATFDQDKAAFNTVVAGFHMRPLPLGACRND